MTGYTYEYGRVVAGVQLVALTHHQFDENDYQGRIFDGAPPECPALIDGVVMDAPQEVQDALRAEQQAAHIAKCAPYFPVATLYRIALNRNFGIGSEIDHAVTQEYALAYFGARTTAGTITPQETADAALLASIFPILAALTPDGTTWSFPWGAIQ